MNYEEQIENSKSTNRNTSIENIPYIFFYKLEISDLMVPSALYPGSLTWNTFP